MNMDFLKEIDINQLVEMGITYGLKLLGALAIFVIGKWIAKGLTRTIRKLMEKGKVEATLVSFVGSMVYVLLMIVVILAALNNLGVNTTSFVAILGAAGLAVGLALQGTLSNVGAAVLLILFRPFKVGDFVEAGGTAGVVEEINMFSTIFKTGDNKVVIVPNSSVIGGNIVNYSAKETRRVDWTFGIGYDDDLKLAKRTLEEILAADERIFKDPAPFVAVSELADSSVNFVARVWVKSGDYWGVYFDTIEKVKLIFDEKGISIPYPQMDVHLDRPQEGA
ncbi:mechanosensitive ion channel family protein [Hydrogenimonas sp.]